MRACILKGLTDLPVSSYFRRPILIANPHFPDERTIWKEEGRDAHLFKSADSWLPSKRTKRTDCFPPKAGKTTLLKQICLVYSENQPDMTLMILLIDDVPRK